MCEAAPSGDIRLVTAVRVSLGLAVSAAAMTVGRKNGTVVNPRCSSRKTCRATRCLPVGSSASRQLPVRPEEVARVSAGVMLQVVLVLGLGLPEVAGGTDLGHHLAGP
jgi:hypothetical protein